MPRLNARGDVAMGIAGHQGVINGAFITDSYGPQWFNDDIAVFQQPSNFAIVRYDMWTGNRTTDTIRAVNDLMAGGNVWAAWADHYGLFTSTGLYMAAAGLFGVGPDGAIGFTQNRQVGIGADVIETSGEIWHLTDDVVYDLQLLGNKRAIWHDQYLKIKTFGIPFCIQVGNAWRPRAVVINNEWWVCYFSDLAGVVLHPFNSTIGYVITPPGVDAFQHDMIYTNGMIKIVWSARAGEAPQDYRQRIVNIYTEPRTELIPAIVVPPINKDCWLGWFEFNQPPPQLPPGNAIVKIRYDISGDIVKFNDFHFANWIDGPSVEEIEQKAANSEFPPVCYWDGRVWPRWPNLPEDAWLALQAYCFAGETAIQFEANMRQVIDSVPPEYNKIALVCQCYTSNLNLTNDLIPLVPVYAKLARDYPRINMLLVFSDQNRATGLNDHPEVRPYWEDLMEGITGEPTMANPQLPTDVCQALINERNKYGASPNDAELAQILNDTAWQFPPDWGVSRKDGGAHAYSPERPGLGNIARDILHRRSDNMIWDVLIAAGDGGPANPSCSEALGEMTDPNRPWVAPVQPPNVPPVVVVNVDIIEYDTVVQRSDPKGMLIRFDVSSDNPIVEIELDLLNDGEPSIPIAFRNEPRRDGRYVRALAFKPTVNGTWILRVSAKDSRGNVGSRDGETPVTVIF